MSRTRRAAPPARWLRAHIARQRLSGRSRRDARRAAECWHRLLRSSSLAQAGIAFAVLRDPFRLGAFDEIFERSGRAATCRSGKFSPVSRARATRRRGKLAEAHVPQEALGLPDRVERKSDGGGETQAEGRGRREGTSRVENLAATDMRHVVDPEEIAATHALAARLARAMRARWCAATKSAAAAGGSICAAPFIAMSRTAACRSISPGAAAR